MLYVHHFYKRQSRELAELPRFAGTAKIHEKRFENTAFFSFMIESLIFY